MAYNVLNPEGERIVVETINGTIHKHLSGRDFTEEELKNFGGKTETIKEEPKEELKEEKELTIKEAKDIYKEKFGRNPSSKMKLESILDKIK